MLRLLYLCNHCDGLLFHEELCPSRRCPEHNTRFSAHTLNNPTSTEVGTCPESLSLGEPAGLFGCTLCGLGVGILIGTADLRPDAPVRKVASDYLEEA